MNPDQHHTLSVILNRIKQLFDERMSEAYFWMKAELLHLKSDRNGHYYLDLIETQNGDVVAKATAQIWNYSVTHLKESLGSDFYQVLKPGSEILCFCKVVFHTVYGMSFIITLVDVQYSLGALERKKRAVTEQLVREGMLDKNKKNALPRVPQRIALIASPNTSGYADFIKQLTQNAYGFHYSVETFATKVQGETAAAEITVQLQRIEARNFDVVVLLRGGGSKFDLEPFNDYELAKAIAGCMLPVITGIGHETDTSIADLVAHTALKTPSATGAFIVERTVAFNNNIQLVYTSIKGLYEHKIQQLNKDLKHHVTEFRALSKSQILSQQGKFHTLTNRIITLVNEEQARSRSLLNVAVQQIILLPGKQLIRERSRKKELKVQLHLYGSYLLRDAKEPLQRKTEQLAFLSKLKLKAERQKLSDLQQYPNLYHPDAVLLKGYALVRKERHIVTPETPLQKGDTVEIELHDRTFSAIINNTPLWKNLPTKKPSRN